MIKLDSHKNNLQFAPCSLNKVEDDDNILDRCIQAVNFTHAVQVVIPNNIELPPFLSDNISNENTRYFMIEKLPLSEFIKVDFIKNFIQNGSLSVMSIGTRIDLDDCICIDKGLLILNLKHDSFFKLGLPAQKHLKTNKLKGGKSCEKYDVVIGLKTLYYKRQSKERDRIIWCLQNNVNLVFDVLIKWHPHDSNIYASSVAVFFKKKGFAVNMCAPEHKTDRKYSVDVPTIDYRHTCDSKNSCSYSDFYEWLGFFSCSCNISNHDFLNSYETPEANSKIGQVILFELKGFFNSEFLIECCNHLRKYLKAMPHIPWISMTLHGFQDSPLSNNKEHHFYFSGDNILTLILFQNENLWTIKAIDG